MGKIPVGLQLFTLRNEMKQDYMGTLRKVAEIGYRWVEFAGYGGYEVKELRNALDDLGVQAVSCHTGLEALQKDFNKELEYCLGLGAEYLTLSSLPSERRGQHDELLRMMVDVNELGERCKKHNIQLCYHNHASEFTQLNGKWILDLIFEWSSPANLQSELDLYWVLKGDQDPLLWMEKYKGRIPLLHVKDMADDAERSYAEVGYGSMNYPALFRAAEAIGAKYCFVEQDVCKRSPLESVKMSFDYLRSIDVMA